MSTSASDQTDSDADDNGVRNPNDSADAAADNRDAGDNAAAAGDVRAAAGLGARNHAVGLAAGGHIRYPDDVRGGNHAVDTIYRAVAADDRAVPCGVLLCGCPAVLSARNLELQRAS